MTWKLLRKWDEKNLVEFKKSDIYNPAVGLGSKDHDPYPQHKPDEIVERKVAGDEFFIEGEHLSDEPLQMGTNLEVDDLKYTIVSLHQDIGITTNEIKSTFVASHLEVLVERVQWLESIRKEKLLGP